MTSEYSPALFQGVSVEKEERTSGVYGGLGYRFLISDTYSVTWVLDLGVNYEPGYVKERRYVAKNEGWFGPTEAELETDIQYSVFPELRFGCNF